MTLSSVAAVVAGFLLGAVVAVLMPPLAFAAALVMGGVLVLARLRGAEVAGLGAPATGFLVAVVAYVVLAVVAAVG